MSSKDSHLYGIRPSKTKTHEISSSTTLSFTSTLSSLLSTTSTPSSSNGRARPSSKKSDIFTAHNKGSKKRALRDISGDEALAQIHSKTSEEVDGDTLKRSKKKMEDKSRLYAAMKRGDYVPKEGERDELGGLIDFDRKWAEKRVHGDKEFETESDDDGDSDSEHNVSKKEGKEDMVEYEDEFGRIRRVPRAEKEKMEKRKIRAEAAKKELEELRARPQHEDPSQLIYGNVIQAESFNPDDETAQKMRELAAKRDQEPSPPPETHYEADKEIRSKGVGFYTFSKDEAERKREMEALEAERKETERKREEREEKKRARLREVEERRRVVVEKRARREADRFLEGLDFGEMGGEGAKS